MQIPRRTILNWLEKLAYPITGMVILTGMVLIANTIWYFISGPSLPLEVTDFKPQQNRSQVKMDLDVVKKAAIFGVAGADHSEQEIIQNTSLRLQLHGTLVSDDPTNSVAFISTQTQRTIQEFHINDTVAGIARLEEIHPLRVILSRGGKREQLMYSNSSPSFIPISDAPEMPVRVENSFEQTTRFQIDVDTFLRDMGLEVHTLERTGQIAFNRQLPSIKASQYGLQEGDQIETINGVPVNQMKEREAWLEEITEMNMVTVEVIRNKRRFILDIPLVK